MISTTDALIIAKQNPYKGTSDQIAKLSISIAETFSSVSAQEFALYKEKTGIQPKIFSKLKSCDIKRNLPALEPLPPLHLVAAP